MRTHLALVREGDRLAGLPVGVGETTLFSLTGRERLKLLFRRLGAAIVEDASAIESSDDVLIVNADYVIEERVLTEFAKVRQAVLVAENELGDRVVIAAVCEPAVASDVAAMVEREALADEIPAGFLSVLNVNQIAGNFNERLRKREEAFVRKVSPQSRNAIERRLFKGSYKGATDFVTKFVLPEPAFHVTRIAAALRLSPNFITSISLLLVIAATVLFLRGEFIAGVIAGWLMCFLDTVDGKLARVTLQSSKFGNLFDHGIDLIHPPFWYAAWAFGAAATATAATSEAIWTALWVVNIGYVVGRLIEGYFIRRHKIEIHIWRPVDYWFRHVTARRNPNLVMLTIAAFAGAPAVGLFAVALWTVISIVFHFSRGVAAAQEVRGSSRPQPIHSWLAE
ncbi:MAG: CDP-alcohol phosphatidyltransferase family protein [Pseudomonadota bacterium]